MEKLGLGRECKQLMAGEIKERLKQASELFITSFNTVAVCEQEKLRRKLNEIDASLLVVKNRLAKQAFQQLNLEGLTVLMKGLTAISWGGRDVLSISKALVDFAEKQENFRILGAYVDKQVLDPGSIKKLASIPSKEALFAQIVYGFKSPIQGLVNCLSATTRNFVVVLDRIREKRNETEKE